MSEDVGFNACKKLIARETENALQGWEGVELMPVDEWCEPGAMILDILAHSSISGERCC